MRLALHLPLSSGHTAEDICKFCASAYSIPRWKISRYRRAMQQVQVCGFTWRVTVAGMQQWQEVWQGGALCVAVWQAAERGVGAGGG